MVPVFGGNIFRTWLTSLICFGGGLYIASWATDATNTMFQQFGAGAEPGVVYSSLNPSANPFTGLFMWCSQVGILAYILIAAILVGVAILLKHREHAKLAAS